MPINLNLDVANAIGNVTIQKIKNGMIIDEYTKHNAITDEGITQILNSLVRNSTSYITGLAVHTNNTDVPIVKFYTFSSAKLVKSTKTYAEFKFYLGTNSTDVADINGYTINSIDLLSKDTTNTEITFASVSTSDVYPGGDPVIQSITKTSDIAIMIIWRIALTSVFTKNIG